MSAAQLNSNNGLSSFRLEANDRDESDCRETLTASITLTFPDYRVNPVVLSKVTIANRPIEMNSLIHLRELISSWLVLPLAEMAVTDLIGEIGLGESGAAPLIVRFGQGSDTISSRHPVATIETMVDGIEFEYRFVTDQSCLGQFSGELSNLTRSAV